MSNMAPIHIRRAEAVRDIENVLDQAATPGTLIVIESTTGETLLLLRGGDVSAVPAAQRYYDVLMGEQKP